MKKAEFKKWTKNGNFTISQERILDVSNHIAEGEHGLYTKSEAAQVATYWSLNHSSAVTECNTLRLGILSKALSRKFGILMRKNKIRTEKP